MDEVNIMHVAHAAGVSISTVSRVVNGVPTVTEENRRRVVEVVNQLHYRPNPEAQRLALRRRQPAPEFALAAG